MLRIPHCLDRLLKDGGQVVNLARRSRFTHKNIIYSVNEALILLE
jgi:hypothetical protein